MSVAVAVFSKPVTFSKCLNPEFPYNIYIVSIIFSFTYTTHN